MHPLENTSTLTSPDDSSDMPPPVFSGSPLPPWVWTRQLYEPTCGLSDLGHRSSVPVLGYMNGLSEEHRLVANSSPRLKSQHPYDMAHSPTATRTAEERLAAILSNQYKRRMSKNRPLWYGGHPLDTAPRCFTLGRRNDVPSIRDWATYHQVTATKAAWMGKVFSHKYYQVNGVIWAWKDPARTLLLDLISSDIMDTVEFAISSDPFQVPHVIVTHSPGEEPEYLDTHENPDQLTSTPPPVVPNPWGCTPRQSFTGPTGMDQLLLPPRMAMFYERDDYAQLCAAATINRRNIFLRVSIQFKEGLRRARIQRERRRNMGLKGISDSHLATSEVHPEGGDLEPMTREEAKARGFSDTDAAESLMARGIMFQPRADDLALMAESAILSEESEDGDDDESMPPSPHSPTIARDTYEVLRRLGMIHCDAEDEGEEDESDENDDENDGSTRDITIPIIPRFTTTRGCPWAPPSSDFPFGSGSSDLNLTLHTETDEQSSVSSCFIDDDSFESGSETPDTDEDDC